MNTSIESLSDTRKKLTVTLSAEETTTEYNTLVSNYAQKAKIPGFRPGKAPANIVKTRFKKDIAEDLSGALQRKAYSAGTTEHKFHIAGVVEASDVKDVKAGEELECSFTIDVYPEIDLVDYKGIETTSTDTDATDAEVEDALQNILNQRAEYNPVERAAEKGDYVRLSYTGTIDGQKISEITENAMYSEQASTWEEAGNEHAPGVPAIVTGIIGMAKEDKKDIPYTFPDDFEDDALKGKEASYAVEIMEVREKTLPEFTEEFLKSLEVESEEQLRERINQQVSQQKEQQNIQSIRGQIQDFLIGNHTFELPQSIIDQERNNMLIEFMQQQMQRGVPEDQLREREEDIIKQAGGAAENRVKLQILLSEIADKESITLEQQDMSSIIYQEAMSRQIAPDQLVKELQKDRERLNNLQQAALFNKVLEFLTNEAKVIEVAATDASAEPASPEA